ncbi:hypothetical protein [Rhodococcus sp. AQ5-07]|uniref:hypothetical protein n=1 Tax=Rhodococcus sp. AQ5-07 TaxID=2054902 RepID=UPI000DBFDC96|nr:hypothetical protein [Rhodococcus sp. AQ5-07]RAL31148.1 hypothetical protein CVN56_29710 [Rhodococcus sp. AQ5-07]
MRTRGNEIEADLRRYYQIDLRDLWRPGGGSSQLTLRLVWVLITNSPIDSALAISENNGDIPWTRSERLLSDLWLIDAQVNSKKGKAPKAHPEREAQRSKHTAAKAKSKTSAFERAKKRDAERRRKTTT